MILHIHPTISEVSDQRKELVIAGEEESLPLATSDVREADNIVRARSGQTIVLLVGFATIPGTTKNSEWYAPLSEFARAEPPRRVG